MTTNHEDPGYALYRARLRESLRNEATNPATAAEREHAPKAWNEAEEADLVNRLYGSEEERLAKLLDEANHRH